MLPYLSPFARYLQSKCAWPGPLEWSNETRSNVNMSIERLFASFCVDNSNVCPICHHLQDIHSQNVYDLDLWNVTRWNVNIPQRSNVNMQIERPYALPMRWQGLLESNRPTSMFDMHILYLPCRHDATQKLWASRLHKYPAGLPMISCRWVDPLCPLIRHEQLLLDNAKLTPLDSRSISIVHGAYSSDCYRVSLHDTPWHLGDG